MAAASSTRPIAHDRNDAEALAAAARASGSRLVYLANPDNPTGSWLGADEQLRMIAALPPGAVLVLDEAYSDFAPPGTLPELDPEDPRVIRIRTFSKAHGMAGMRVGYAIAPAELIADLRQDPPPFRREPAVAGGGTRLAGRSGLHRERGETRSRRAARITRGSPPGSASTALPSTTNFVAIDMGSGARARATLALLLEEESCFLRMPGVPPLDRLIRVTVGTAPERRGFAAALARILPKLPA